MPIGTPSRNIELTGPVNMTAHDSDVSVGAFDTSATGVGTLDPIITTGLGKIDSRVLILNDIIDIFIAPGEMITISGHTKNSSNASVSVSVTWKELF